MTDKSVDELKAATKMEASVNPITKQKGYFTSMAAIGNKIPDKIKSDDND